MELDILLEYVLMVAIGVAIIFLFFGKFVDVKVMKFELEEAREALNLLQTISTSSDLLVKDSNKQPIKLMFDKKILDEYNSKSPNEGIFYEEKCCNAIEYDYNLEFTDLKTDDKWSYGNLKFDLSSECYSVVSLNQKVKTQMPVNICEDGKCDFATASIELARTPLSELAFWISQVCLRQESVIKTIPFDQNSVKGIKIDTDKKEVCVSLNTGDVICKKIYCGTGIQVEGEDTYWSPTLINGGRQITASTKCFNAIVNSTSEGIVHVKIPEAYIQ